MAQELPEVVKSCSVLLLDIEGTTTSISFVKDKLFPYAEANVKQFLEDKWEEVEVKAVIESLRKLAFEDEKNKVEGFVAIPGDDATKDDQIEGLVKNVKWMMSSDRKIGPLKLIQGLIWKKGYDSGDIKGHVYEDVPDALKQWKASGEGRKVYIYSSGSVQSQKLIFGQSDLGDLLPYIDGHFDTEVGAKQEVESYKKIVESVGVDAGKILFLTDIPKEAEAAVAAGLKAVLVSRSDQPPTGTDFQVITSMADLYTTKRKLVEATEDTKPSKVAKTDAASNGKDDAEQKMDAEKTVKHIEDVVIEELPADAADEASPTVEEAEMTPIVTEVTADEEMEKSESAEAPVEVLPVVLEEPETKGEEDAEMKPSETEAVDPVKVDIEIEELVEESEKTKPDGDKVENGDKRKVEINGKEMSEQVNGEKEVLGNGNKHDDAADGKNGTIENGKNGTTEEEVKKDEEIKVKTIEEKVEIEGEKVATA